MEKFAGQCSRALTLAWLVIMAVLLHLSTDIECSDARQNTRSVAQEVPSPVKLIHINNESVSLDNGILRVTISIPGGDIKEVQYNHIDNLLETNNNDNSGGYWDLNWKVPPGHDKIDRLKGRNFTIIMQNDDQVEISFTRKWYSSSGSSVAPLNIDKRYIMRRGISGFYAYAIYERIGGWPAMSLSQTRIVFKLKEDKFHYMALSDYRQRNMPTAEDRRPQRSIVLDYPEAVLMTNPTNPEFKGEVDDKYQYSGENKDNKVYGWVSSNNPAQVGFWLITPSDEFLSGGPVKQDLTSHVGPTILGMFTSTHYAGTYMTMNFTNEETWKKVFGPIFIYLNTSPDKNPKTLWEDAKKQMLSETSSWPYDFVQSKDFPPANQRGIVSGQLLVFDRYIKEDFIPASYAYVGLALPGDFGSWQVESKGYQFWTQADKDGNFIIKNIRPGVYNLYGWVPRFIGDYKYQNDITITTGSITKLKNLVYKPPRDGPTLWEIGIPDRTAAEFYVPDPIPSLINHLYKDYSDRYRQYGLWKRYQELYPKNDLVFNVGTSNYSKDWFFAQVTRNTQNIYASTTWKINFSLKRLAKENYTLRLALAAATDSDIEVRFNNPLVKPAHFFTGKIGRDNAIARHGIHGLYKLFNISVPSTLLKVGINTIFLTQALQFSQFQGVMYDYIRLEGPQTTVLFQDRS